MDERVFPRKRFVPHYGPAEVDSGNIGHIDKLRTGEDSQTGEKQGEIKPRAKHTDIPGETPEDWAVFNSSTDTACIRPFGLKKLPGPRKRDPYNDDINTEHFQGSSERYAGKQRRGVIDEHLEFLSKTDHIDQALSSPFFLSVSVPRFRHLLLRRKFLFGTHRRRKS